MSYSINLLKFLTLIHKAVINNKRSNVKRYERLFSTIIRRAFTKYLYEVDRNLFYSSCLSLNQCRFNRRSYSSVNENNIYGKYEDVHRKSLEDPESFWNNISKSIVWFEPFTQVMDNANPPFTRWFVNGKLNTCYNALDRHVIAGNGSQIALIHDSPISGTVSKLTYQEVLYRVSRLAGYLVTLGVKKGDFVLIYMPMIPETVIAMLAVARIGAIHSVVFGGFAAANLADRLAHCQAKIVISASYGLEPGRTIFYKPILDEALKLSSHKPKYSIIFQRSGRERAKLVPPRDVDWMEGEEKSHPHSAVPVDSNDPLYVLYTSGTTGSPKGIVRTVGGHCVVLPWTMKAEYGMEHREVWWAASDFGWEVGHAYTCYAPLINLNTSIVYEGKPVGTPDAGQFFRVISDHNVKGMFLAPTTLRSIAREDPDGKHRKNYKRCLRNMFVAGEFLDHDTRIWAEKAFECPALDHWWQTETGFAITTHAVGLGMNRHPPRGVAGKPFIGYNVQILDSDGKQCLPGQMGRIAVKLPLPPATLSTLFKADDRFVDTYFSSFNGYYDTMDAGTQNEEGYVSVQARVDDVINVAGHRLSTTAIEEAILGHPDVVETAVVGVPDDLKGEIPFAFFIISNKCMKSEELLKEELVALVREVVGPVCSFKLCSLVKILPKTRSGKIPRKTFSQFAKTGNLNIPPTIDEPNAYDEIVRALNSCGFPKNINDK